METPCHYGAVGACCLALMLLGGSHGGMKSGTLGAINSFPSEMEAAEAVVDSDLLVVVASRTAVSAATRKTKMMRRKNRFGAIMKVV
ncbi:hypothetical protein U9M48_031143 [Paspalum notatum var. saurae]|uniref:Secreted protein n=1 Tax=Paspalum notatum var. saurae TaxID=547442 RepID=A0AAQ3X427_PASNO